MPRLLAGPCFSVILPAPSSIFLTSPLMLASCAVAAVTSQAAANRAAAVWLNLFIVYSFLRLGFFGWDFVASFHGDVAGHAVIPMSGNQAGTLQRSGLAE